jgi:hypothetical protein
MALGTTGRQQRVDAACLFLIEVEGADDVKRKLDPKIALETGCRVIKHPDCCVLCAANNDCTRIPLHWQCRCKPEGYLTLEG